jgi:cell division protein ZipA
LSELRWALLILGVVFFAALTVWELRRPRQARSSQPGPQAARPPEIDLELPEMHAREPLAGRHLPLVELPDEPDGVPMLVPAAVETAAAYPHQAYAGATAGSQADADAAGPEAPEPQVAEPYPAAEDDAEQDDAPAEEEAPASDCAPAQPAPRALPELPAAPAPLVEWPPDAERRVVALRLVATQAERFAGRSLRQALAAEGFVLGRFDIFHKGDEEQRAVLSAASLSRPGTFDVDTMDSQHFGGLSLFAVLPGPMSPPRAFEELVTTARSLNNRLCGVLQDESGMPLTPARIATLRERLSSGVPS